MAVAAGHTIVVWPVGLGVGVVCGWQSGSVDPSTRTHTMPSEVTVWAPGTFAAAVVVAMGAKVTGGGGAPTSAPGIRGLLGKMVLVMLKT